jgi:hypothetical protein
MSPEQFDALREWIRREAQMLDLTQHDLLRTGKVASIFEPKRKAAEDEARRLFVEPVDLGGETHYADTAELVEPNGPGFRTPSAALTEAQIKHMVSRFLGWRLPETFHPDNGISFTPEFNAEYMASLGKPPMRHDPVGTNLFDADQATAMVRYMLEGLPIARDGRALGSVAEGQGSSSRESPAGAAPPRLGVR